MTLPLHDVVLLTLGFALGFVLARLRRIRPKSPYETVVFRANEYRGRDVRP